MGRRFERHLDVDLIAKVQAGIKPHNEPKGLRTVKPPRPAKTYRAARRNQSHEQSATWRGIRPDRRVSPERRRRHVERFGKMEVRPLTYKPNGARERERRGRQHAKANLALAAE